MCMEATGFNLCFPLAHIWKHAEVTEGDPSNLQSFNQVVDKVLVFITWEKVQMYRNFNLP